MMKVNWVTIYGKTDLTNNEIALITVPAPPVTPNSIPVPKPPPQYALIRSNVEFEQGTISLEVKFLKSDSSCHIRLSADQIGEISAGLNIFDAAYGFAKLLNNKWEMIEISGQGSLIAVDQWHELQLRAQGSNLDLYFNGVKVASASHRVQKGPVSILLQGENRVTVRNIRIAQKSPVCFVVMQFTDEYNALYHEVISPTCEAFGYNVVRADDFYTSGLIIEDITRSIQEASIVIADVTPNNANVFYEVGYAHGIGKPTILLSDRKRDKLPFDISGFRTLFYDNTIGGKTAVEERLKKHLENIVA